MQTIKTVMIPLLIAILAGGCSSQKPLLSLDSAILLPGVKGEFDLMSIDLPGQRLFVSAQDNNTVEVLDLKNNQPLQSIPNQNEPKWSVYCEKRHKLYIADGGDATLQILNSQTLKHLKTLQFKEKTNDLRYDEEHDLLYVGVGDSFGALGLIDTLTDTVVGQISLAAYPKQFELESSGARIFINEPSLKQIEVVDRNRRATVAVWGVAGASGNDPMALDETHQRLFIGCTSGKLIVFNTATGQLVTSLAIAQDCDGVWYNQSSRLIYISCGEGVIDIVRQTDPNRYELEKTIATAPGASTSLWNPSTGQLFLAVPEREGDPAAIQIYRPRPERP